MFMTCEQAVIEARNRDLPKGSRHKTRRRLAKELPDSNWLRHGSQVPRGLDRELVNSYKGMGYAEMNFALRAKPEETAALNALIFAVRPLPRALTVYRLVTHTHFSGSVNGYISTTVWLTRLLQFASAGNHVLLRIRLPAGARALWLGGPEREVLLAHGPSFAVTASGKTTFSHPPIELCTVDLQLLH